MKNFKINWLVSAALLIMSVKVFAQTDYDGQRMHVQIANETSVVCQLTNQNLYHGKNDSAPPQSIMPHDSKTFDVEQITSFYGPDILLQYQCGQDFVSFELAQDASILVGHTPYYTIQSITPGITIDDAGTTYSSLWWEYPGILNLKIKPVA